MPTTEEDAALAAIATLDSLCDAQLHAQIAIQGALSTQDPFVDVHELFGHYSVLYFRSLLVPRVNVFWSPKLTLYVHGSPECLAGIHKR